MQFLVDDVAPAAKLLRSILLSGKYLVEHPKTTTKSWDELPEETKRLYKMHIKSILAEIVVRIGTDEERPMGASGKL